MERKIREIFDYNGEWYQCVEGTGCYQCAFNQDAVTCLADNPHCTSRSDRKDVLFKRLEKVGEPITVKGRTFQKVTSDNCSCTCTDCVFNIQNKECYKNSYIDGPCLDNGIWVEIKQNKEDTMEETKLNIKPFSLEAAKAGKPVCTRDGRKARIICFDANSPRPIIALINTTGEDGRELELIENYYNSGQHYDGVDNPTDLMMFTEKRLAWVNVYRGGDGHLKVYNIYDTREDAEMQRSKDGYIATAEVSWDE